MLGHRGRGRKLLSGTTGGQGSAGKSSFLPVSAVATTDTAELVMGRGTAAVEADVCESWGLGMLPVSCLWEKESYGAGKRVPAGVRRPQRQNTETSRWMPSP